MKNTLETRLGIYFVLVAFAGVMVLELSGIGLFKRGYTLHGDFLNVQELKVGDPVKMAGVQVGRVEKVGFHENKVRVSMRLTRENQIRTDSVAAVKFTGLMGQNFVSLTLGAAGSNFKHDDVLKIDCDTCEHRDLLPWVQHVCTDQILLEYHTGPRWQWACGPFGTTPARRIHEMHRLFSALEQDFDIYAYEDNEIVASRGHPGFCGEYALKRRRPCVQL